MFKNISPDSVPCGRTCKANLGVRSYPVRKLICPVRLRPIIRFLSIFLLFQANNMPLTVRLVLWQILFL